jgi:hypothetical protein
MEIWPEAVTSTIDARSPINAIHNPAVIVKYAPGQAKWETCAVIEVTGYTGSVLDRPSDDDTVVWTQRPATPDSKGRVAFFEGKNRGLKVHVYGVTEGEVVIEADFGGKYRAVHRALVAPLVQIHTRMNILKNESMDRTSFEMFQSDLIRRNANSGVAVQPNTFGYVSRSEAWELMRLTNI